MTIDEKLIQYGVVSTLGYEDSYAAYAAVLSVGSAFSAIRGMGETAADAFKSIYGTDRVYMEFQQIQSGYCPKYFDEGGCTQSDHHIQFVNMSPDSPTFANKVRNAVHELGHAFSKRMNSTFKGDISLPNNWATIGGYGDNRNYILRPNVYNGGDVWQYNPRDHGGSETFADIFVAYIYDVWNLTDSDIRNSAMQQMSANMAIWIH
jgi:hypothetical protein